MSYFNTQEREAIFIYLFMHVDGISTKEEKERFNQICKELKVDNEFKAKLYEMGKKLHLDDSDDNSEMVISLMNAFMNSETVFKYVTANGVLVEVDLKSPIIKSTPKLYFNKAEQAFMIWTMVNLGYADTSYSKAEQKIVKHLVSTWEMDKTTYNQIITFAETILSLEAHKKWVVSTNKTFEEISYIVKKCDSDIKKISKDIEIMIQEIYI